MCDRVNTVLPPHTVCSHTPRSFWGTCKNCFLEPPPLGDLEVYRLGQEQNPLFNVRPFLSSECADSTPLKVGQHPL